MRCCCRCLHVQTTLGKEADFQALYRHNRSQQLAGDLQVRGKLAAVCSDSCMSSGPGDELGLRHILCRSKAAVLARCICSWPQSKFRSWQIRTLRCCGPGALTMLESHACRTRPPTAHKPRPGYASPSEYTLPQLPCLDTLPDLLHRPACTFPGQACAQSARHAANAWRPAGPISSPGSPSGLAGQADRLLPHRGPGGPLCLCAWRLAGMPLVRFKSLGASSAGADVVPTIETWQSCCRP